jgi:hypothetical protein
LTDTNFERDMFAICRRARDEVGYTPSVFLRMLEERGAIATAKYLLSTPRPSDGFVALWEANRSDLTVEHLVLQPSYSPMFTESELQTARQRLGRKAPP